MGDADLLTLQIKGAGAIGGITVTADSRARVKGYVDEPMVLLPPTRKESWTDPAPIGPGTYVSLRILGD